MKQSGILAERRVALFVDGDNLPSSLGSAILETAQRCGRVDVSRVYAAEGGIRDWSKTPGYVVQFAGGTKNAADLLICIDAVELACSGGFDAVMVATDDRDFSHLAARLRQRGLHVFGLGTVKSSEIWRAACSEFALIEGPSKPAPVNMTATAAPPPPSPKLQAAKPAVPTPSRSPADKAIRNLILAEGGSIGLGTLGVRMGSIHRVTLATLGAQSWRAYLAGRPDLYLLDPKGPVAQVRLVCT